MRETGGHAEKGLYTADTWSVLITEPHDCPQGGLWSSVSLSLPASVPACLCGCRHAVCVSQRVKYTGIGSGVCVCTWTSLCLAFLQANRLRCQMTIRLKWGAGREKSVSQCMFLCLIRVPGWKYKTTLDFNIATVCAFIPASATSACIQTLWLKVLPKSRMLDYNQHCQYSVRSYTS